ncbi:MAG: caspase family protein [Rhodospirillales bacterium]|nr:caspase family protein [Rhodospirillales bacterium]
MKRALVIGIDHYPASPLAGCVNDASQIAGLLETHGDGSPNFDVVRMSSDSQTVTAAKLQDEIVKLFAGNADTVLLYFAGHGILSDQTNVAHICAQDARKGGYGMSLAEILQLANSAADRIKSSVIILDSCHSGFAGETVGSGSVSISSVIGNGVTIMTACQRDQTAAETGGAGLFTSLVAHALRGGAADILGRITPAAVYAHVDQTLGGWEQRPIYKANVHTFVQLRQVPARVPAESLRNLPRWFPTASSVYSLGPSCEPNRDSFAEQFKDIKVNPEHHKVYREMQRFARNGLVEPVDFDHMWDAAMNQTGCRLTALGAHYRRLAEKRRI